MANPYPKYDYSKKLLDPRWQKKRLEILQRDEFRCVSCGDGEETLHVHHCYYKKDCQPWDYENTSLVTLCKSCHETETEFANIEKKSLLDVLSIYGFLSSHINEIMSTLYGDGICRGGLSFANNEDKDLFCSSISWAMTTPEMMEKIKKHYLEFLSNKRQLPAGGL